MKKIAIWSSVGLLVVVGGIAIVRADLPLRARWRRRMFLGYVSHQLGLTSAQQSQIRSIWQEERPTMASLVRELGAEGKDMNSAAAAGSFDAPKVQEVADRQAATVAKLSVEKEKMLARIYSTVLTPAQRSKADVLRERWNQRLYSIADRLEGTAR